MKDNRSPRNRLIALIHAQKNAAGLSDDEYKTILYGATGKGSCTDCAQKELFSIFNDLNSVLEKRGQRKVVFRRNPNGHKKTTIQDAVIYKARQTFGDGYYNRLQGYLKKMNKIDLASCDFKEIRQIMGWLSTEQKRGSRRTE